MSINDMKEIKEEVNSLQKDMYKVESLVDRLDATFAKLTEVSSTLSQLLAVQGTRIESQEKISDKIQDTMEKHKDLADKERSALSDKIDKVKSGLESNIENSNTQVLSKIEELRIENKGNHDNMDKRMSKLERLFWIFTGAATIFAFILDKINLSALFG